MFADENAQLLTVVAHDSLWIRSVPGAKMPDSCPYPILVDPTATVSATYGAAHQKKGRAHWMNRQVTFVIDRKGIVRHIIKGNNRRVSCLRNTEELLEAVKGL